MNRYNCVQELTATGSPHAKPCDNLGKLQLDLLEMLHWFTDVNIRF